MDRRLSPNRPFEPPHLVEVILSMQKHEMRSVARLVELGHKPVKAFNPYWDKQGKTFDVVLLRRTLDGAGQAGT
jgi:hypothetical protein